MDIKQAWADLGVNDQTLSTKEKQQFDQDGFFVVKSVLSREPYTKMCDQFDQIHQVEGKRPGWRMHQEDRAIRLSNVLNKTTKFYDCLYIKPLLAAAYHLLKPDFKVYGFNIREACSGHGHQRLHSDYGPAIPAGNYCVLNSLILLDPFTEDNGATLIVPGAHLSAYGLKTWCGIH